jgi:AraC-like DNA-binding protein/quercetin dioxygenase-like cupin family protein
MKIEYERIQPDAGSSFRVVHWKSDEDRFFWHYHPEYELVYIHKGAGKRHVGLNVSHFEEGDLMFLGPDLPHLNFGYGAVGEHEEIVVQLRDDFLGESFLKSPELVEVKKLFDQSRQGIQFFGATKQRIVEQMLQLPALPQFEKLVSLLQILHQLASSGDYNLLNASDVRFGYNHRDEERIRRVHAYVEQHYAHEINIRAVADLANLTVPSFCRYFKKMMRMTFTDFVNEYRVNQACKLLPDDRPIADVAFATGFNQLSHFTKTFKAVKGQTPRDYRRALVGV